MRSYRKIIIEVAILLIIMVLTFGCRSSSKDRELSLESSTIDTTTPAVTEKTLSEEIIEELQIKLASSSSSASIYRAASSQETRSIASILFSSHSSVSTNLTHEQIQNIIDGATQEITNTGLSDSENIIKIMPALVTGSESALNNIGVTEDQVKMTIIDVIVSSVISSLKGREEYLNEDSKLAGMTTEQTVLHSIAEAAIGSLDDAGISSINLSGVSRNVIGAVVGNLDEFISSADDLKGVVKAVTAGAAGALDDISTTGYDADNLVDMVKSITAGATQALGDIQMTGYDADDLVEMVAGITEGATESLDDIGMAGYNADDLDEMVKGIAAGATGALDEIDMTGYDATDIDTMTDAIKNGVKSKLPEIQMEGYSHNPEDTTLSEAIDLGAKSELALIDFEGYTYSEPPNTDPPQLVTALPDTGQSRCYGNTGVMIVCPAPDENLAQDGSYTIDPPSYTDNGDGTVTDNNTGLMWQQQDSDSESTWSEAESHCSSLSLGGRSDWRLPNPKELLSIIDFGVYDPSINQVFFTKTTEFLSYWSSANAGSNDTFKWLVHLNDGTLLYTSKDLNRYFRCVRSGSESDIWSLNFSVVGNGTVIHQITGLTWQQDDADTAKTWKEALGYCEDLSIDGYDDWRLPTVLELQSIIDYSKWDPAVDSIVFLNTNSGNYWSSTTNAYRASQAWIVGFNRGLVGPQEKYNTYEVRCVRVREPVRPTPSLFAPTNLTATAVSSSQINLTWVDNADNESGFVVERSTSAITGFSNIANLGANSSAYSDFSDLGSSTTPYYRVYAANSSGNSEYSNTALAQIRTDGHTARIPDTGQTACYNGSESPITCLSPGDPLSQDGSYNIDPPSYTDNGDGTVTDNNTGLMWQQKDTDTKSTWSEAINYCSSLSLGGLSDWRLPNPKELLSIIDFGVAYTTSINPVFSTNMDFVFSWSSASVASDIDRIWEVYLNQGSLIYNHKDSTNYIRCVRSDSELDIWSGNFSVIGNRTVVHQVTGLIWQQDDADTAKTWIEALGYCENLSIDGADDWRLPNVLELQSIIDYSNYDPAIDSIVFPNTKSDNYWSSTTNANISGEAWFVGFNRGRVVPDDKDNSYQVRCVRIRASAQPPLAPTNLTAAAASNSQIDLTWVDNADNESAYVVERSTSATTDFAVIADLGENISSYSDTAVLAPSTTYYYRVYARNSLGNSSYSNTVGVQTQTAEPVPTVPADPTSLSAVAISSSKITLSWTDNSDDETGFRIERSGSSPSSGYSVVANIDKNSTSFENIGLSQVTTYWYRVRAYNAVGNSGISNTATAKTLTILEDAMENLAIERCPTSCLFSKLVNLSSIRKTTSNQLEFVDDSPVIPIRPTLCITAETPKEYTCFSQPGDKFDEQPVDPDGFPAEVADGDYVCTTRKHKASAEYGELLSFDSTSNAIWPGTIIDGNSVISGDYIPITAGDRSQITLSMTFQEGDTTSDTPITKTVRTPTSSAVKQAIDDLLVQWTSTPAAAKVSYQIKPVYSDRQLEIAFGSNYGEILKQTVHSFTTVNYIKNGVSDSIRSRVVGIYKQKYYTASMEIPGSANDFFDRTLANVGIFNNSSPIYVSRVSYGRMVIFEILSSYSSYEVTSALNAMFRNAANSQFNKSLTGRQIQILQESLISVATIGGTETDTAEQRLDGHDEIKAYLERGGTYSANLPGDVISYQLRFLKDNEISKILFASEYDVKFCPPPFVSHEVLASQRYIEDDRLLYVQDMDYPFLNAIFPAFCITNSLTGRGTCTDKLYPKDSNIINEAPNLPEGEWVRFSDYLEGLWCGTTCWILKNPVDKEMMVIDGYISKATPGASPNERIDDTADMNRIVSLVNTLRRLQEKGYKMLGIVVTHMHGDHNADLGMILKGLESEEGHILDDNEGVTDIPRDRASRAIYGTPVPTSKMPIIGDYNTANRGYCSEGYPSCYKKFTHWMKFKFPDGTYFNNQKLTTTGKQGMSISADLIKIGNKQDRPLPLSGDTPMLCGDLCQGKGNTGKGSFRLGHFEIMPIIWDHWDCPIFCTGWERAVAYKIWHTSAPVAREVLFTPSLGSNRRLAVVWKNTGWLGGGQSDGGSPARNYPRAEEFLREFTGFFIYTDHLVNAWGSNAAAVFHEEKKGAARVIRDYVKMHNRNSGNDDLYVPHYVIAHHVDSNDDCGGFDSWQNSMAYFFLGEKGYSDSPIDKDYRCINGENYVWKGGKEEDDDCVIILEVDHRLGCEFNDSEWTSRYEK